MFERLWRGFHHRDIEKRVQRHGWTGIYVGDYHEAPTWAYTIGFLTSLGAPEIVVFDVQKGGAEGVFQEAYAQLKSGDLVLRDGEVWRALDGRAVWRQVHSTRYEDEENAWLGLAVTFDTVLWPASHMAKAKARPLDFQAFQLVLSDNDGHFPWEAGYDERLRPRQRALYEPTPQMEKL